MTLLRGVFVATNATCVHCSLGTPPAYSKLRDRNPAIAAFGKPPVVRPEPGPDPVIEY